MAITISVKLIRPENIDRDILSAISRHLNKALSKSSGIIESEIKKLVFEELLASPEVASVTGGQLYAEFGDPDAPSKITDVIAWVVQNIFVQITPVRRAGTTLTGALRIGFAGEISSVFPMGKYTTKDGTELPWLEWLLTLGDRIIVIEHEVTYDNPAKSRTGGATMKKGRGWSIPAEYSGVEDDNFITRSIQGAFAKAGPIISKGIRYGI